MAGGNAIARGSVILSANADDMNVGLDKAEGKLKNFGKKTSGAGGGAGGMLGGLGMLGKAGPIAGIAAGILSVDKAMDTLAEKTKLVQVADAFQVDPSKFSGIAGLAKSTGEDIREFTESLVTMGKVASEGAAGKGEVSTAFFKDLNLNAQEFVKLKPDEQFFKVFEALNKVQDPLTRVRNLMVAFGEDGGKYLLPLLSKTPEELRKMAGGFQESTESMRGMAKAQTAITQVKTTLDRTFGSLVSAVSPIIEVIAPQLEGVFKFVGKAINALKPAFEWYGRYLGQVWEIVDWVFTALGEHLSEFVGRLDEATAGWFDFIGPLPTIQEVVVGVFRVIGTAAAYVWDTIMAGMGYVAIGIGHLVENFGDLVSTFKGSAAEIISIGADMAEAMGLDETSAKLRGMADNVESVADSIKNISKGIKQAGASAVEDFGKSAVQFNNWLDNKLKKDKAAQVKGIAAAMADPAIAGSPAVAKWASVIEKGSKEAYQLELRNKFGDRLPAKDDAVNVMKANGKKQDEANKQLGMLNKQFAEVGAF
jgi:uncharacterized protein YdcH (DUF465 family)